MKMTELIQFKALLYQYRMIMLPLNSLKRDIHNFNFHWIPSKQFCPCMNYWYSGGATNFNAL